MSEIRRVEERDLPRLEGAYPEPGRPTSRHRTRWALQEQGEGVYLVAWQADLPIGWVFVHRPGSSGASEHARRLEVAEIMDLWVADPFRGLGHGSALLLAAEDVAVDAGWRRVGLEITVSNPHNDVARAMYERHGYTDAGFGEFQSGYSFWTEEGERRWAGEPHRYLVRSVSGPEALDQRRERVPKTSIDPKRVIAEGYDRMGEGFAAWNDARPREVRAWFLTEVLTRLPEGSRVLELGCGPGTDAAALSRGRRYVGVDLSPVQVAIARRRAPGATFVVGDFTRMAFRPASFDGVVAFFAFNHAPKAEVEPTFRSIYAWLRPRGRFMTSLLTIEADDRVEEWLGVPMFFAGVDPDSYDRFLGDAGFELEMSEIREEVDPLYGPTQHRWVIGRKPGDRRAF